MRIALFSDIHGNVVALDAVLADIARQGGAGVLVAAGDLIGGESGTDEILERLEAKGALCVQGDSDTREKYLQLIAEAEANPGGTRSPAWHYRRMLDWIDANLSAAGRAFLDDLPLTRTLDVAPGQRVLVCHASPRGNADRVCAPFCDVATFQEAFADADASVVAYGHAHEAHVRFLDDRLFVNVAAVAYAKDDQANWTRLEWGEGHWKLFQYAVSYDVDAQRRRSAARGVPEDVQNP